MSTEMELVVDAAGEVRCIYDEGIDLREIGTLKITRASHVEPDSDGNWWADMGPVGGPVLGPFKSRSEALVAEREWLSAQGSYSGATTGPLYSITTWDYAEQAFTPQKGLTVPSINVSWRGLLAAVRKLWKPQATTHFVREAFNSNWIKNL